MTGTIIIAAVYMAGVLLSFSMLRVEHASEKQTYTKGDRILCWLLSLFSLAMVLFILARTWVWKISKTGYWNKPVKPKPE